MFKRRDIPPVLLLLLLIILVMLTLSQILVVHNGRYGRNVHNMRKLQLELREMDVNLHALMMQNVPSIELNRRLLQNEINAHRFAKIISEASQKDPAKEGLDLPSSRLKQSRTPNSTSVVVNRTYLPTVNLPRGTVGEQHSPTKALLIAQSNHSQTPKDDSASGQNGHHSRSLAESELDRALRSISRPLGQHSTNLWHTKPSPTQADRHTNDAAPRESIRTVNIHNPAPELPNALPESATQPHNNLRGAINSNPKTQTKYCPSIPPLLKGNLGVNLDNSSDLTWEDVANNNPAVEAGGTWAPSHCVARHRVAIIIPYRDREQHLITLLYYLHPILQRQQLDYTVYVVEQFGKDTFNKARIMNIAFVEALKQYHFQCFVFHDVDLVPEDDRNMYSCPQQPRHMSVAIDEMGYKLAYQELVGGVLNMRTEHFQRVNGYSNLYWGWGAEDDDMAYRIMHVGLKITRPPEGTARYKMAKHTKRKPSDWRKRAKLLYTGTRRFQFDGLNSLQYKVQHIRNMPLYTHVLVDIGRPPRGF